MNQVFGIFAHVDAGKTTLSEQLLYHAGATRALGRVDNGNTLLDTNRVERERGITIFSDYASFSWEGGQFFLLDTPGHVDFSGEMERTLSVLDFAILVVSCVEGIQSHTETLWQLLKAYQIPTLIFLNKTDRAGADRTRVFAELRKRFSEDLLDFDQGFCESAKEALAERDEAFLEFFLNGIPSDADCLAALQRLFAARACFPCLSGAALSGDGVDRLLALLPKLLAETSAESADLRARVYKIAHDEKGQRLTFLKITGGTLSVKEVLQGEKINEIRFYQGAKYTTATAAQTGILCAVTGLTHTKPGMGIGTEETLPSPVCTPALIAGVQAPPNIPPQTVLHDFLLLSDEDPLLQAEWENGEVRVHIMGAVQLAVLPELVHDRFGYPITFGPCRVAYRESIRHPVMGYGHFEPLRHYAEVHLRLDPMPTGSGISFRSECPTDVLALNWQRLIETHVFEKVHRGVLTGAPLDDVQITLVFGRAHLKHTEGGDFREAVYRAIRQALRRADCFLLEPLYRFSIDVPLETAGRVLTDIQRMHGTFDPPASADGVRAVITGTAPVATMMNYAQDLAVLTRGKGTLRLFASGYAPCHNEADVLAASSYDPDRDIENPADSVFCSHGAGFPVSWREAERYMISYP